MNASDALFELIKSLSKSEKGYFKKFSSLHVIRGKNNYVKIFDAIAQQKEYDEKKIIALFDKEKFAMRFAVTKQYLYNLVLNSLNAYHTNVKSQLAGYLHSIAILYKKGLYSQCEKLITKAKQLAMKYDLQSPLIELMQWEAKLMGKQSFIGTSEDKIRQIFNNIFSSIEQYKTNNNYLLHIYLLYLNEMKTGLIRNSSDMKALKRIMEGMVSPASPLPPLQRRRGGLLPSKSKINQDSAMETTPTLWRAGEVLKEPEGASFQSLYLFYTACSIYFSRQNDHKNADMYEQKLVQLMDANPHQIIENLLQYAYAIHNLFVDNLYLKKYQKCAAIIVKLEKIPVKSTIDRIDIDFMTNNMNLSLCIETGEFHKGLPFIKSTEEKMDKMDAAGIGKWKILRFQYNTAYLYFATKNYTKANEYLNKILHERIDIRNDAQCFAQILSLIVHFEMGNQSLLEYRVKSVHGFLYKRNRLYKLETIILDFIRKELPKIDSDKALLKSFEVLLTKIKVITNDPFERRAFDYFDFISWMESKIEGRVFAEVVRENAGKIS